MVYILYTLSENKKKAFMVKASGQAKVEVTFGARLVLTFSSEEVPFSQVGIIGSNTNCVDVVQLRCAGVVQEDSQPNVASCQKVYNGLDLAIIRKSLFLLSAFAERRKRDIRERQKESCVRILSHHFAY